MFHFYHQLLQKKKKKSKVNSSVQHEGKTAPSGGRTVPVSIADVNVVDVSVRLQCEDQTDDVRSREKHRDRIHQRPAMSPRDSVTFTPNIETLITDHCLHTHSI